MLHFLLHRPALRWLLRRITACGDITIHPVLAGSYPGDRSRIKSILLLFSLAILLQYSQSNIRDLLMKLCCMHCAIISR